MGVHLRGQSRRVGRGLVEWTPHLALWLIKNVTGGEDDVKQRQEVSEKQLQATQTPDLERGGKASLDEILKLSPLTMLGPQISTCLTGWVWETNQTTLRQYLLPSPCKLLQQFPRTAPAATPESAGQVSQT